MPMTWSPLFSFLPGSLQFKMARMCPYTRPYSAGGAAKGSKMAMFLVLTIFATYVAGTNASNSHLMTQIRTNENILSTVMNYGD
ncbi:hypothetical protein BDW02DRAFT_381264 [Decorospora gaudefroyi]|uniref:Uncharacterized protein n=1 Tax=Decorospora gaudefroyi TaxID=184978 RepID=A0A6A5KDD4_9PLEO|nr:hypothetical protein BDW02DRAFT_381264 [Decorospora gaudefroyi]